MRRFFSLIMKLFSKILTAFKPTKLITKVYEIHKNASLGTKLIGLFYLILLAILLNKGLINSDDFINVLKDLLK